jgi:hypothetical protein
MENNRPDWVQQLFDEELSFWKNEYPLKSNDEKIKYWAAILYKSMRDQEESGLKTYAIYTENWLINTLEREPNFIDFLPKIYNIWGGMFDTGRVDNIIQKHIKNIEKK